MAGNLKILMENIFRAKKFKKPRKTRGKFFTGIVTKRKFPAIKY
jgi:hypothetical protein